MQNSKMSHVRVRQSFKIHCDPFSILLFRTAITLTLMHLCKGQSEVVGPLQPVVALIGDDIILPSNLKPDKDASDMTVEWARPDLDPRFVLVWRDGVDLESKKHPSYKGRTSLFTHELKSGNISLKISKVRQSDEGMYRCFVPELKRDTAVQLVVGAASSPVAQINRTSSSRVVLQCESAGWYPEPELLWVDGEGNLLSADPTETLRGPDNLYAVSSRVTVEKRHSNNITCRVQQKNINQSRETHIHVPDDFFMVISPSSPPSDPTIDPNTITGLAIGAVVVLALILAVFCVVWKRRRAKSKHRKMSEEEGPEQIMEKKTINIKSDNTEFQVVVEAGESEPLITGREEENDVDIRGEQSREDERETEDQLVTEREQVTEAKRPEEEMMNLSVIAETESQFTTEEEERTGREVKTESEGEKTTEAVKEHSDPHTSEFTGEHKEQPVLETNSFNYNLPTEQDQHREKDTQRGKDTQQERATESDGDTKQPNAKKKRTKKTNKPEKKKKESRRKQQKNQREEHEAERQREENQRKLQSERRTEREEDETDSKTQKDKHNHDCLESKTQENTERENKEKHPEEDQRNRVGTTGRKPEEEKSQTENIIPTLSNKVPESRRREEEAKSLNSALVVHSDQEPHKETQREQLVGERQRESDVEKKRPDVNKENVTTKNDQEKNVETEFPSKEQQKNQREERQREETQRKLQSERRAGGGEDETEVTSQENKHKQHGLENNKTETSEAEPEDEKGKEGKLRNDGKAEPQRSDQENISAVSRKVREMMGVKIETEKPEKQPERESKKSREEIREQPEKLRGAEDVSTDETHRKEKETQQLRQRQLQTEQQENINQRIIREQPEKLRGAESKEGAQREVTNISTDETHRKEKETPQLSQRQLQTEQQENINQKIIREQPEETDQTPDGDQKNIKRSKNKADRELHQLQKPPVRKRKHQRESRAWIQKSSKMLKEGLKKQSSDQMEVNDPPAITRQVQVIKHDKEQQKLPVQEETRECLKGSDDHEMADEETGEGEQEETMQY